MLLKFIYFQSAHHLFVHLFLLQDHDSDQSIAGNELAEKIGVNRQTISMYENNKLNNPEFATIQKIANELHFPIRFFLENDLVISCC
mgnify:CR=1 FL=1